MVTQKNVNEQEPAAALPRSESKMSNVSRRSSLHLDENNVPHLDESGDSLKLQLQPDCDELIATRTGLDLGELKRALKMEYMVRTPTNAGTERSCPDGEFEGRVLEFVEKYCKHLSEHDLELVMNCSSRMRQLRNSPDEQEAFLKDLH